MTRAGVNAPGGVVSEEEVAYVDVAGGLYSMPLAEVQPSTLIPGTWNLYVRFPTVHRRGKYDTEEDAKRAAQAWCDRVEQVLMRARSLK